MGWRPAEKKKGPRLSPCWVPSQEDTHAKEPSDSRTRSLPSGLWQREKKGARAGKSALRAVAMAGREMVLKALVVSISA
jgi:hypothetical protein